MYVLDEMASDDSLDTSGLKMPIFEGFVEGLNIRVGGEYANVGLRLIEKVEIF